MYVLCHRLPKLNAYNQSKLNECDTAFMKKKLHEKLITKMYFIFAHKTGNRIQRSTFIGSH